jgi:hypothetical protein
MSEANGGPVSVEALVEYGLETIPEDRRVSVSLRDLMYVFQTLGELNRFFHQPSHWKSLADIEMFVGNRDTGAYRLISQCYYHKLSNMLPPDIEASLGTDRFDSPNFPCYYALPSD